MNYSDPSQKRGSRGWWRIIAGLLFIAGGTLALAYYLPLRQSHELLNSELSATRVEAEQVSQSLATTQERLAKTTSERDELSGFKTKVESEERKIPDLAQQLARTNDSKLTAAFKHKQAEFSSSEDAVIFSWTSPALVNWQRTAPTWAGHQLLCASYAEASRAELPLVNVRTFVASNTADEDLQEELIKATALASDLGARLVRYCKLPAEALSVTSSRAASDSPLLQLEFRRAADAATAARL